MQYIVLAVYLVSLFMVGLALLKLFPLVFPKVIGWVSMMLTGIIVGVPITYFLSCLFAATRSPMRYGALSFIGVSFLVCIWCVRTKKWREHTILESKIRYSDICLAIIAVLFSCYIMWKSVHIGTDATWLVSRNTVFDSAHALSLIRSFSLGNNIPFTSPFAAGSSELYHFIFYFFIGLIEQCGIPLIFAFNAVSTFGFAAYLVVGFYTAYILSRKNTIVGWMTVVFLVTHSTMTWWFYMLQQGIGKSAFATLWHLPNYLFAGPYDGSVISLFFTLNVFVNQRHLAFAIAAGYIFFLTAHALGKQKKVPGWVYGVLGGVIGLLFFWNLVITVTVLGVVTLVGIGNKKYTQTLWCLSGFVLVGGMTSIPFFPLFKELMVTAGSQANVGLKTMPFLSVLGAHISYWAANIGVGVLACVIGCVSLKHRGKSVCLSMGILFFIIAIGIAVGKNEIAQKMLNFWNVAFVGMCAFGVWFLWKKGNLYRLTAILLFFGMTASGVIDLMVIKNDFAYPAVPPEMNKRVVALQSVLPKNAVVLSYTEMFHDISFAGHKQYYGYFAPPSEGHRFVEEKEIFTSTTAAELDSRIGKIPITHVYLPKHPLSDFPYGSNLDLYRSLYKVTYEDGNFILFDVSSRMVQ